MRITHHLTGKVRDVARKRRIPTWPITPEGAFLLKDIQAHLGAPSATEALRLILEREGGRFDPLLNKQGGSSSGKARGTDIPGRVNMSFSIEPRYVQILELLAVKMGGVPMTAMLEILIRDNALRLRTYKRLWETRVRKVPQGPPEKVAGFGGKAYVPIQRRKVAETLDGIAAARGER